MPIELRLPQLAESVTSVTLAVWLKREGDAVEAGEPIAEIETDKTTVELEAPATGVLQKIHVAAGTEGLEVGRLLAVITEKDGAATATGGPVGTSVEESAGIGIVPNVPARSDDADPNCGEEETRDVPVVKPQSLVSETPPANGAAVLIDVATPLAHRMARAAGIDLAKIQGTGRGKRILKADVDRALRERRWKETSDRSTGDRNLIAVPPETPASPAPSHVPARFEEQPLSAMQRATATRLAKAKQTIPHFYLRIECAGDAVLEMKARSTARHLNFKLTLTEIFVRAAALALRKVPRANSAWADTAVRIYNEVDIAVAVETPAGLITPIVRAADTKNLATISHELKALTERAREGRLEPEEYSGGTFTVSNLGMYGVESLYAIVNPPQSCILGIGAAQQRPIVRNGELSVGTVIACTLSADHRTTDGTTGAALLAEFRSLIEEPALLTL